MKMNKTHYIVLALCFLFHACKKDDTIENIDSLAKLVAANAIEIDNVIACASGSKTDDSMTITYVYPRSGATGLSYYETIDASVDKDNYANYIKIDIEASDVFNGYLKKFTRSNIQEKWVIITFFEDNKLHLSNPIRLKHRSKPTEFIGMVEIDAEMERMPVFQWQDGIYEDNRIYFQVISDDNNDLLSGTYTFEKQFQYYKLENVVLNISAEMPPQLNPTDIYNFTLMGVSEDNWVNLFVEKRFTP
ncbi:hypothetical protein AB832_05945 [Flavobacteriaceae bacterium (ex Bugula neritina AB1)]|nr:hypothetical protein AB832_05945 [Flavobacteriaceae bacterium (ex Bugula neritina AB1)]